MAHQPRTRADVVVDLLQLGECGQAVALDRFDRHARLEHGELGVPVELDVAVRPVQLGGHGAAQGVVHIASSTRANWSKLTHADSTIACLASSSCTPLSTTRRSAMCCASSSACELTKEMP